MHKYTRENIISKINRTVYLNANNLSFEQCYYLCANKYKLDVLLSHENQIMYGRRGTGKTTLFKAFCYYVNSKYQFTQPKKSCWYTRLDDCIPNGIEINQHDYDNVILFCIKKFLSGFLDFLYTEYISVENSDSIPYQTLEKITNNLIRLSDIVEEGYRVYSGAHEVQSVESVSTNNKDHIMQVSLPNKNISEGLKIQLGRSGSSKKEIGTKKEKKYVYKIDISEIKKLIENTLQFMAYETLYICIDEFTQIDRDIPLTIQPRVAQILKMLFFNSQIVVVKIASVWNESRMQNRQINGIRLGLELGQDIFSNPDLDLDTMFDHDNEKAYTFFKNILINDVLIYENEEWGEKEKEALGDYIIKELFSQDSFKHLICGSQGIPRVFGNLLVNCLKKLKDRNKDKITVEIVFDSIISNYILEVRQSIPYSSPICTGIDEYVLKNKCRFFLVEMNEYNEAINYFDGLVANNALHQCPSEQLPRTLRNKYKLFYIHYGNYLESLKDGIAKFNNDVTVGDGLLYPAFPADVCVDVDKYLFKLPVDALNIMYCTYCHKYFNKDLTDTPTHRCPKCDNIIAFWE